MMIGNWQILLVPWTWRIKVRHGLESYYVDRVVHWGCLMGIKWVGRRYASSQ